MKPTIADYFNQEELYFSESRDMLLPIKDMPFQQALFSHRKLLNEFGNSYKGTPLYRGFIQKLCPPPEGVRQQLEKYGKACHVLHEPDVKKTGDATVRSKLYQAARGKKVTTHKVNTSVGAYIEATVPVPMRKRKAATKA